MNFFEYVKKNEQQMIKDIQGLLQIDSTLVETPESREAPFGEGIRKSLDYILELGKSFGFKVKNVNNVAGHIEYGEGEEIIGILCHVDVVPAVGKWKYPPFSATIEDGKIYARGAVDDKGPTICSLYAMKILKDLNIKLNKRVRLIIGTDEETKWRGIEEYFKVCEMPDLGFSPDADFPVIYGEKGIMSIDLTSEMKSEIIFDAGVRYNVVPEVASAKVKTDLISEFKKFLNDEKLEGEITDTLTLYGKSAHAMEPKKGVNAAIKLCEFLSKYSDDNIITFINENLKDSRFQDMGLQFSDPEMKDLTVNVAIVKINEDKGKIGLNLRYPINWNKEEFLKEFARKSSYYKLQMEVISDQVPHYVDKEDFLVKALHNAYLKYTNDTKTPLLTIGGGTYARALKKGVAFGIVFPNREDVVHQVNEYLIIEDAILATAILTQAIHDLGR